jgi:hypothetical protein
MPFACNRINPQSMLHRSVTPPLIGDRFGVRLTPAQKETA